MIQLPFTAGKLEGACTASDRVADKAERPKITAGKICDPLD